jgi:hypothetical protein
VQGALTLLFSSSSSPFSNCSIALLIGMSWSHLRDTQGFGMQCAAYIHRWIAFHPGIKMRSTGFSPAIFSITILSHGATAP